MNIWFIYQANLHSGMRAWMEEVEKDGCRKILILVFNGIWQGFVDYTWPNIRIPVKPFGGPALRLRVKIVFFIFLVAIGDLVFGVGFDLQIHNYGDSTKDLKDSIGRQQQGSIPNIIFLFFPLAIEFF